MCSSLTDLTRGRSKAYVSLAFDTLTTGGFSINVHLPDHPYLAIACSTIPKR